jgi:hypothetical protein
MTRPSPFAARLFALQISSRPEDAEELAFLEDYMAWHSSVGQKVYEARRASERNQQLVNHHKLNQQLEKRKP